LSDNATVVDDDGGSDVVVDAAATAAAADETELANCNQKGSHTLVVAVPAAFTPAFTMSSVAGFRAPTNAPTGG
jgi:peroxiredoxin